MNSELEKNSQTTGQSADPQNTQQTEKQLHKLMKDLGSFIALYEQSDDQLKVRKEEMDNYFQTFKSEMKNQFATIQQAVTELSEVMTAAGAARWRVAAEKAVSQGEDHLKTMREVCDGYKKLTQESVTRLDQVSVSTEKRIAKALHNLSDENFAAVQALGERTQAVYDELDAEARGAIATIRKLLRWLKWDRIGTAVIAGLVASLLVAVYVNGESPWESHKHSVQERTIGKTLLTVWPSLDKTKQDEINRILGTQIKE